MQSAAPDDSSLTPAQRKLNELVGDRARIQHLAGAAIDRKMRERLVNVATRDPRQSYRTGLNEIAQEYPDLWRAWQEGYLRLDDFRTLKLLVPSTSGVSR